MKPLSRRRFLRGAGGVLIALPFLDAMRAPKARAAAAPKRFIVFFTGLGTVKERWVPIGTEASFSLTDILSPLNAYKDKLLVLEGIDMKSAYSGPGDPHQAGIGQALTGTELQEGTLFPYACDPGKMVGWGGGISLDQFLAKNIGNTTKLASLELGVQVQYSNVSSRLSYLGPGQPVPPDDDPWNVYARLFTDLQSDPEVLKKLRANRHKVIDAIKPDYQDLVKQLGSEDRQKVEAHLTAMEEIEARLDAPGLLGGNCQLPDIGQPVGIYQNDNFPLIGKLQLDLLTLALACDLTRVATVQWSSVVQGGKVFTWLGQSKTHHDLSHSSLVDPQNEKDLVDIGNWYAKQLAYFMDRLAAIPEADGSVLDNTLILWCSDIAVGQTHERKDMPYVLAGGAGGALKMGRYLKYSGDPHNNLLVSLCNAMDVPVNTFGNPDFCTGPLAI